MWKLGRWSYRLFNSLTSLPKWKLGTIVYRLIVQAIRGSTHSSLVEIKLFLVLATWLLRSLLVSLSKVSCLLVQSITGSFWTGLATFVTRSRWMNHLSAIFNFEFSALISCPFKMLHFDPNPILIGHLVVEIWTFFEV